MRGGIDLGGTKIEAIVLGEDGEVLGESRRPTPTVGGPSEVATEIVGALGEAATDAGIEPARLRGVGVGSPGTVNRSFGTVSQARNLPEWEGSFPLAATLQELLDTAVFIDNDVRVAVEAEFRFGAGQPYDSFLGVFWGTGVGGGLVLGRESWFGCGAAGEIGHVVVKKNGARCPCGRRGCLEAYAGRAAMEARARDLVRRGEKTALFKIMEKRGRDRLTSGIWSRALKAGDPLATRLIDRAIEALGVGIASAINLLDVEAVVIGGGLGTRLGAPYVERIQEAMRPHLFVTERQPAVHVAALEDLSGALGAALLVPGAHDGGEAGRV